MSSRQAQRDGRRPRWVYDAGQEPDYRFSLANERTFLAWIRTSLAFMAAAVALDVVELSVPQDVKTALALLLVIQGVACAGFAWWRWATGERAMRLSGPLPAFRVGLLVAAGVAVAGIVIAVAAL